MLKGMRIWVNGTRYIVSEGSAIYIAPEAVHMMKALSSNAIGYNVVLLPAVPDQSVSSLQLRKNMRPR